MSRGRRRASKGYGNKAKSGSRAATARIRQAARKTRAENKREKLAAKKQG